VSNSETCWCGSGDPINRDCKVDSKSGVPECTNWTRVQGWSSVVAMAPTAIPLGCGQGYDRRGYPQPCPPLEKLRPGQLCQNCSAHFQITGVRYAWAENPWYGRYFSNLPSCSIRVFCLTSETPWVHTITLIACCVYGEQLWWQSWARTAVSSELVSEYVHSSSQSMIVVLPAVSLDTKPLHVLH
jgi:hypothetical protein